MKKIIGLILGFVHFTCFSQSDNDILKLTGDIEIIKISENAYIHVSYTNLPEYGRIGANGLIFINNGDAFLFDTPWTDTQTKALYSWITGSKGLKLKGTGVSQSLQ